MKSTSLSNIAPFSVASQRPKGRGLAVFAIAIMAATLISEAFAAPGNLDANFNADVAYSAGAGQVNAIAVQPDGKILIGGSFTHVGGEARSNIARLNTDGSLDTSFQPGGPGASPPGTDGSVGAVAVLPDGKIFVGGSFSQFAGTAHANAVMLNADGSPAAFSPSFIYSVYSAKVRPDGKIMVGGSFDVVNGFSADVAHVVRLNADGSIDPSFVSPFNYGNHVEGMALDPQGRVILIGQGAFTSKSGVTRQRIARLELNGDIDTSFDASFTSGRVTNVIVDSQGRILICRGISGPEQFVRLSSTGAADPTFAPLKADSSGPLVANSAYALALQAGGKVLMGEGYGPAMLFPGIARVGPDGGPAETAPSFDPGTGASYGVLAITMQADGKVLVGGAFDSFNGTTRRGIVRLDNDVATESLTVSSAARVEWLRGGSAPEASGVSFEVSVDNGITWAALGQGTRIEGGWERIGLSLPPTGKIRARAIVGHVGYSSTGSGSGIVENVQDFTAPPPVLGTGNVWLAGLSAGTARNTDTSANASPIQSIVAPVPGQYLSFTGTGGTHNGPAGPGSTGPDGGGIITHDAENFIAPLTAPINALVGIFLDDSEPSGKTPASYLDYTESATREAKRYAPGLRQPFFIGDGRTTAGATQVFRVPAGATRLFLGSLDTFDNSSNYGSFDVTVAVAPPIDTVAPPPNLVSWWPGENTAWDVMGIGRGSMKNASRSGADAYGTGKVGRAFVFDGVDDHIEGRSGGISLVQDLTIECWINPTANRAEAEIVSKRDDSDANVSYALFLRSGQLVYQSRNASVDTEIISPGTIALNQWTHVAATESATNGRRLFVNGVEVGSTAGPVVMRPSTTGVLTIGAYVTTANPISNPGAPFPGSIDELSLYNRALTSTEIATIHSVGEGGKDRADPVRDFSAIANPNSPWKYGWIQAGPISTGYLEGGNPSAGDLFPIPANTNGTANIYQRASGDTAMLLVNDSDAARFISGTVDVNPLQIAMTPSPNGAFSVLRWVAPESGRYAVSATFTGVNTVPATTNVYVYHKTSSLFGGNVTSALGDGTSVTETISVGAGDTVDWIVGSNDGSGNDETGVVASVALVDRTPFQIPTIESFKFSGTLMAGKTVNITATSPARPAYPTMTAQLQYSATPTDLDSWVDVPGATMTPSGSLTFILSTSNLPVGRLSFRIATSVVGVGDAYSVPSDMYDVLAAAAFYDTRVTAISGSDPTGQTTHRSDYIDYLVQFRNTGTVIIPTTSLLKIEAKIPTGSTYFNSSPAATVTKTGTVVTGLTWPIIRNFNPVDKVFTFTAAVSGLVTAPNHGLDDGDTIMLRNTDGKLPGGLYQGIVYKVMLSTSNGFKLAESDQTTAVKILNVGTGTHSFSREGEGWQSRKFRVTVTEKTLDTLTPTVNPPGTLISTDVKLKTTAGEVAHPSSPVTTVVNPLLLTGALRGDSQYKQGGFVYIDFTVKNAASYTASGVLIEVRAPAGMTLTSGAGFVNSSGEIGSAPIDPITKKIVPPRTGSKFNPSLEEDAFTDQVLYFNLGSMAAGATQVCRASFRIQYDFTATPTITFNHATVRYTRTTKNEITRTLSPSLVIPVAAAPSDPKPSITLSLRQTAAGVLPSDSDVAIVFNAKTTVPGSTPARPVNQILYRATYRNLGLERAEFVRLLVPIPANTTYVAGSAIVKLPPGFNNPTGTILPTIVGGGLIFNLPYLEAGLPDPFAPPAGSERTLEFRVTVKSGPAAGTRITQTGGSVVSRDLSLPTVAIETLQTEVSTPAKMHYRQEEKQIRRNNGSTEVQHRCFYTNSGTLPATGVALSFAIPAGYKFIDAAFLDASGAKIIKSLSITKPLPNATSGTVNFPVGTVKNRTIVNGYPVSDAGWAVVRLAPDTANPPPTTGAAAWRRDGAFLPTDSTSPPPMLRLAAAPPPGSESNIKTSLAPSKLWIGVLGAVYSYADQDITYQIVWGSCSDESPGAGGMSFPIPPGTTYVRHTPSIPLTGQYSESGNFNAPGTTEGGTNGLVGWGYSSDPHHAVTAFVTVHVNAGFTGTIVCEGVTVAGDQAGVVQALTGRTTILQSDEEFATRMTRIALDSFPSVDMAFSPGAAPKFVPIMKAIVGESTWACFGGTDALVVSANNAVIIPLGGNQIVAVGGGNIVAAGGGNIIQGISGAQIVAGGGGNIVAGGGGNIFSGVTNIVAAGGGNIVAAGGGNAVSVDVGGRGMMKVSDIYKDIASIVAAGGGNIVAGGGMNLIEVRGDVVSNDGAGLIGLDGASLIGLDGASLGTFSVNALSGALSMIPPTLVQAVVQLNKVPAALIGDGGGTFKAGAIASLKGGYVLNTAAISAVPFASLIGDGGGTLIGDGGGTLIGDGGGTLVGAGGSTLIGAGGSTAIGASVSNLAPGAGLAGFSSGK